jgi:hypothetical protein
MNYTALVFENLFQLRWPPAPCSPMGRFTMKLKKLKLQGPTLAPVPFRALGWTLNKYSLSYLTLYIVLILYSFS